MSKYIHGIHDQGGVSLMSERPGWIVITKEIGDDPSATVSTDYRPLADLGFGVIVRLNLGYFPGGTIPTPDRYERFSTRVANYIQASQGCPYWIVGNEPNHAQERPEGRPILPQEYAQCFALCSAKARVPLIPAAVAPWNAQTSYPQNERGDWVKYFEDMLQELLRLDIPLGGISLHTYTHGTHPDLIASREVMEEPFEDRFFQFRAYRDFLGAVPESYRHLPVYITEANQEGPWLDEDNGWIQAAYREINEWNSHPDHQAVHAMVLYRWQGDMWAFDNKGNVKGAFREVVHIGYQVEEEEEEVPEPTDRINLLKNPGFEGAYRDFDGIAEVEVGEGWIPWWKPSDIPTDARPEYKIAVPSVDPRRIHTGQQSQQWFTTYKTHTAGIYQVVEGIPFGSTLRFEAWVQCFTSGGNDFSKSDGRYRMMIGIDPYGGTDFASKNVIWSKGGHAIQPYDQFVFLDVEVIAKSDRATVFVWGQPEWPLRHNNGFVDTCILYVDSEPSPEPEPEPGPEGWTEEEIRSFAGEEARDVLITALRGSLDYLVGNQ